MKATDKIEALIDHLESTGGDPARLDVLRATQRFKRSWVDLAERLVDIRKGEGFRSWDYEDFYDYCNTELHLKRATVDKLCISFSTLRRLAPHVLQWDGVSREMPSLQAVDYFGKAVDAANDPEVRRKNQDPRQVIKDLRRAVFDEGQTVRELKRQFDPMLHPQPKSAERLAAINRVLALARKLTESLGSIDGLPEKRLQTVERTLGTLRTELEDLATPLRDKVQARKETKRTTAPKKRSAARA